MRSASHSSVSRSSATGTGPANRAGPSSQTAFLVHANPRFGVSGSWWTGVVLQQACEAILHARGASGR